MPPKTYMRRQYAVSSSPLRRLMLVAMATVGFSGLGIASAHADPFPAKPITLIVPAVAGGAMDGIARLVAQRLGTRLGQPVVVDSKPGAGGTVGMMLAAKAPADGHTLVIAADSYLTVTPRLMPAGAFQPTNALMPVVELGSSPMVLVVNPSLGVRTLPEYLAKVRGRPGTVTYGSAGSGSPHHLFMAMLDQQLGLKQVHVPYKGGAQAFADLLGGHVDSMFIVMSTAEPYIKSGKVIALGVSGSRRLAEQPNVPAIGEIAPGYESEFWFAILAPKGTPPAVVTRLNREIGAVLAEAKVTQGMQAIGVTPASGGTPDALVQKLRQEDAKMDKLIRSIGLKPE
ncbi:conserved exported hypothetical protein [Cupriavidus oxalaticus]|uniref:Tripartite tricarboxylate transporter substrate binding protein n=2 Tax=Cupriavidus oxalaticus TaxID=96344 RepID=A0A375GJB0_9BURK|nr:conserved exported hypothetical protein [Cupriavidus oxalaticus]